MKINVLDAERASTFVLQGRIKQYILKVIPYMKQLINHQKETEKGGEEEKEKLKNFLFSQVL